MPQNWTCSTPSLAFWLALLFSFCFPKKYFGVHVRTLYCHNDPHSMHSLYCLYTLVSSKNVWLVLLEENQRPRINHPAIEHSHSTCQYQGSDPGHRCGKASTLPPELNGQTVQYFNILVIGQIVFTCQSVLLSWVNIFFCLILPTNFKRQIAMLLPACLDAANNLDWKQI